MSDIVFDDVVVSESGYEMGENNTFNNLVVNNDAVLGNYQANTVAGMTIEDEFTFVQFTKGTVSDVEMLGGKFEVDGSTAITNIVVDGSLYSQEVGTTGDNNADTGFSSTQLVIYSANAVVENLTLKNGGSAFLYNGATLKGVTVDEGGVLYLTNWNQDADTTATVEGDLVVNAGGTLWIGGNGTTITGKLQTFCNYETGEASNIIWNKPESGNLVINDIILRGANIDMTEGLEITNALQGGNQTVDGAYIKTWQNNYGTFTVNSGTVDKYIHNTTNPTSAVTINGGTINDLDLTVNGATNYIYGGTVNKVNLEGTGGLRVWADADTVVSNVVVGGSSTFWVGDYDNGLRDAKATNVTFNSGVIRVDGTIENLTQNGGYISLYGGVISGYTTTAGDIYNWGGDSHKGTVEDFDINSTTTDTPYVTWNNGTATSSVIKGGSQEFNGVTFVDSIIKATDSVVNDAIITNGTINESTGTTWNNLTLNDRTDETAYYVFADGSIINGLESYNAVNLGSNTTAKDITMYKEAIVGYGEGTTVDGLNLVGTDGAWAQFYKGEVSNLTMTGTTKFEAWEKTEIYGAVVDAEGVDVEFGKTKVGAQLVVLEGAYVEDLTLKNGGSAHIYQTSSVENVTATDGGVLYMTNWNKEAGSTGTAEDVYITSTGGFVYNLGGEIKNLTIEAGANLDFTASFNSVINGVYKSGIAGIGDVKYSYKNYSFVAAAGTTFMGNYGTGVAGAAICDELTVFEGGSLYGWNLGTSEVTGKYITNDGTVTNFTMGTDNEFGGKHAEGVYFFKGLAVLGSGAPNDAKDDVAIYNTSNNLTFDASTYVVGNMTKSTNLKFVNGSSIQTYSNAEIAVTNLDEATNSIYRNGSIKNGVVSNMIFENGGFVWLYKADQNYAGSPAGHAQDIKLVGKTDVAIGNYTAYYMNMFGGYSFLVMQDATTADGVTVGENCTIYAENGNVSGTNITLEAKGNLHLTEITADTSFSGTKDGVEFTIADCVVSNYTLDSAYGKLSSKNAVTYDNFTITAGTFDLGVGTKFTGTTYIGRSYNLFEGATINWAGDVTFENVAYVAFNEKDTFEGLNSMKVVLGQVDPSQNAAASTTASLSNVQKLTVFGGGSAVGATLTDSSNININGDSSTTAVFGGGLRDFDAVLEDGQKYYQVTKANVTIEDGTHALVAGGGYGADIVADVNVTATNAEFTGLVTGGGMGNVGGNVTMNMTGVTGTANIFGGASASSSAVLFGDAALAESVTVAGNVNMTFADSSITGMVFGGGNASGTGIASSVAGDVNITVTNTTQANNVIYTGGYSSAWLVGGGMAVNGASADVAGSVNISVSAGSTVGNIVGGGQATGSDSFSVVASTNITIAGSTVTGNVYGGGYSDGIAVAEVSGNVSIMVDATADTSILGNIYVGGRGSAAVVSGDAEVVFTGSADALSFTGKVSGTNSVVSGTSTISFASFTGNFAATVENFDVLSFAANTAMSFETTVSVANMSFDLAGRTDANVAFVDATNIDASLENIELSGIGSVTEDSVFTLATSASESLVSDAMFSIMDDNNIEIGTFTFGEELVIEGVGSYIASLTEGVLTVEFKKELDDTNVGMLA